MEDLTHFPAEFVGARTTINGAVRITLDVPIEASKMIARLLGKDGNWPEPHRWVAVGPLDGGPNDA